jgi:hypothetical protein
MALNPKNEPSASTPNKPIKGSELPVSGSDAGIASAIVGRAGAVTNIVK